MESSGLLAEVPSAVRDLVIGHWPETSVEGMRNNGDAYLRAGEEIDSSADRYEAEGAGTEQEITGVTQQALGERHRDVATSMRAQAAVCKSLGKQCHDVADSTVQVQHLLTAMGIALAAQLAYDALLFFQGGGAKALIDRLEAEEAMRAAAARFTAEVAGNVAAGAAQRAALHGAVHAAKIGLLTSAAISGGAQAWDLASGVRDKFDVGAFLEMLAGGVVGGVAGAEVGRRVAPRVFGLLGGRATSRPGRLAVHMGGTMLIGGAGGLAGGLAGAVPSVIIHHGEINSLGDLFKMVRESVITGFGSGFVGAAGSALRVHLAGAHAARGGRDTTNADGGLSRIAARQRDFAADIRERLRSGIPPRVETIERFTTAGKSAKVVERLIFQDGTEVIHKVVSDPRHAHAELLSSLVGDAVGARVPAVHVIGDHVYMEVVPGKVAADAYPRRSWPEELFTTPAGLRQGVLDVLTRIPDRNSDNWMVDPDGNVWGIDHSRAFEDLDNVQYAISPFAEHFQHYGPDNEVLWSDHSLTRSEVLEIRQRVEELSPVFSVADRVGWHDVMLQRLDALAEHAAGDGGPRVTAPGSRPPFTSEPSALVPEANGQRRGSDGRGVSATPRNDRPPRLDENMRQSRSQSPWSRAGDNGLPESPQGRGVRPPVSEDVDVPIVPEEHLGGRRNPLDDGTQDRPPVPKDVDVPVVAEEQPGGRRGSLDDGTGGRRPSVPEEAEVPVVPEELSAGRRNPLDEPTYDGPPTRSQPRAEPHLRSVTDDAYALAAAPPPSGATMFYRHPDGGYVDVVLTGEDGTPIPLRLIPGQEYVLGRGKGALLENVATDGVSRRHATLKVDEQGHVLLRDENSKNGTFVDGKQLTGERWVRIYDGQDILLSRDLELGVTFQRQIAELRLFGNDGPTLTLHRGQEIEIGRSMVHPEAQRRMTISARHATVGMDENGRVWIRDDNSTNGTRVNDERLAKGEQRTLAPGDSVELGRYLGEAQFVPADGVMDASPLRVRIGGSDATPVRLEPGQSVVIGTDESSPFASQLRGVSGIAPQHATLGLDNDGRLWIRDHRGSDGVWINGSRIAPNQRVTLTEGDSIGLGPDYVGTARLGGDEPTQLPPAELHYPPHEHRSPIRLQPGQEVSVDVSLLNGHTMIGIPGQMSGHQVVVGRDLDGRIWVRDPNSYSRVRVNDEAIPPGEKRYLNADDKVSFDNVSARVQLGEEAPLTLRLSDDDNVPPLTLRRGEEVMIGRDLDSPMADQLADHSQVSRRHATIYRDEYGNVWLRDEHSTRGTWVDNLKVDPDQGPVRLRPGDQIRLGDWVGAARFADGYRDGTRLLAVKLNGPHGDLSLDLARGGEPVLLGRDSAELPDGLPRLNEMSRRHASIGTYPSGRVWIRDEGSTNHTYVNGKEIKPGTKVMLHPGDHVRLADSYEFTVAYPPPDGGAFVNVVDRTPETRQMLEDLARVPSHIYARVSEHMNAVTGGGIVIGNRPLLDLPGTESLAGSTPYGRKPGTSWNTVGGVYMGGPRRVVINSGGSHGSFNVVWHEFGHAADAAYGTGGKWLSDAQEWRNLHATMLQSIGKRHQWNDYFDKRSEAFAEAFTAWMHGGTAQLRKFALNDKQIANQLKDYFDRVFG
ncbi:FHA domain-containing protein [Nocardia amamiensis]|uniref:FHA domain-containing protein n=1 Tax=Nocardia amamiensis TaxID=404578 RepID=UPI00082F592E|nr:FHA domain-containing protein [Nocardia amamiensis]